MPQSGKSSAHACAVSLGASAQLRDCAVCPSGSQPLLTAASSSIFLDPVLSAESLQPSP